MNHSNYKNHYALIILLIIDMNKHRTENEMDMYRNQFLEDLKLLNALLIYTDLVHLEDNLDEAKRICITRSDKDAVDNGFKGYPIHTNEHRKEMLKWISK